MQPFARRLVLCSIFSLAIGAIGCAEPNRGNSQLNPFHVFDVNGKPLNLWTQEQPAVTVVVFTRTDCPISNRYAPEIRRLYEQYHPLGVNFFLVYVDPRESPDAIRRHLQEFGYPCPAVRDPDHSLVAHCNATITPEAVVFDRQHAIAYRGRIDDLYIELGQQRAESTTHDLADAIESTVQGRPVARPQTTAIGCLIADLKS